MVRESVLIPRPIRKRGAPRRLLALLALTALASCGVRSRPPDESPLSYRQAEDAFRLGDYERAVLGYESFLRLEEDEDLLPRAYYKLALAEFRRGRAADCLQALDRMERRFPGTKWPRVDELRGDVEQSRGNAVSALRWWEIAWSNAEGDERLALHRRIRALIAEMDASALTPARAVLQSEEIRALVDARLRPGSEEPGEPPRPEATPPAAAGSPPPSPPAQARPRVGCLLPLSGAYAAYGQRSLNGIQLAFAGQGTELLVRDTEGQAQVARAALDELIHDPSVVAVIGPLRSNVAEAIAVRAERAALPLVLLSQREAIAGQFVLQPVMTYERQAAQLAEYATTAMGVTRVGTLYPSDGYGSGLARAFEREFIRRGGQILGMVAYSPGAREFSVEALSVQKWRDDGGLQGVFLPDYAETAFVLARELRRILPEIVLLGSNGWNDPARLGESGAVLDDAVFVDGFFAASARPATQAFVAAYRETHRSSPQILEAQAYDAAMLVREAIRSGARSRADLVPALRRIRTVQGAAGTIGIGSQGVQRELFLLRFARGTISELAPDSLPETPPVEPVASPGEAR
jgi:ABC-type branched-subunit amino acid transport system substrate-binding protein